jgi:single-stranded-DNA-specific exonuclease RecJ
LTRWIITPPPTLTEAHITAADNAPLLARLLVQRGVDTPDAIQQFLHPLATPAVSGLELPGMDAAIKRILKAIDEQEPILIYGDFDVDGITGTSVLMEALTYLKAKISYYIPDRALEGHGLHAASLMRLISSRQVKVVISTDTGITNYNEVCLLNNLGVSSIITDHHELGEVLPPSVANINPRLLHNENHPLAPMAGVGVAYKLCELLLAERQAEPVITERLLDLVAIGTIADVAPLTLENRRLVQQGITVMNRRERIGVKAILEQAGTPDDAELTAETVGFTLGPRLNAIGRLENANDAVKLLTTQDPEEAKRLASHLEALNRRRKEVCDKTHREAEQFLRQSGVTIGPNPSDEKVIILASPDWHLGVIGIVASRLVETYHVPVFLMVHDTQANTLRCSARSIKGFSIVDALAPLTLFFTVFGGHAMAGGFTLPFEKFDAFKQALQKVAAQWVTPAMMVDELVLDATIPMPDITPALVHQLAMLEPTGQGNRAPVIGIISANVSAVRMLNDQHLKLVLTDGPHSSPVEALYWRLGDREAPKPGDTVDVAGAVSINRFNGQERPQMIMRDFRLSQSTVTKPLKGMLPQLPTASTVTLLEKPTLTDKTLPGIERHTLTDAEKPSTTRPTDEGGIWLDHRHRESLVHFVGMLLQDTTTPRMLYHEGRDPAIPYLHPAQLWTRERLLTEPFPAGTELIFWDLPPDGTELARLMRQFSQSQSETTAIIHWLGGKYQAVPTSPPVTDFVKILLHVCNRQHGPIRLTALASRLATSQAAVLNGLTLLNRLGYVDTAVQPVNTAGVTADVMLTMTVHPPNGQPNVDHFPLEREALQLALMQVGKYRQFLLSAPDTVLKPLIGLQLVAITQAKPTLAFAV